MPSFESHPGGPRVGIVVAAHAPLATALADTARDVLADHGEKALAGLACVEIEDGADAADSFARVGHAISQVDAGAGVLVLADLFGGSAANIALAQLGEERVEVVTGANLAMLLEALSARDHVRSLSVLAERVAEAARQSVVVASALLTPSSPRGPEASGATA